MIGKRDKFWGGFEKQTALKLRWRRVADCSRGGIRQPEMHDHQHCNTVEWSGWDDWSLISTINWLPSVLWRCWLGHLACKNRPEMNYNVSSGTLISLAQSPARMENSYSNGPRYLSLRPSVCLSVCHTYLWNYARYRAIIAITRWFKRSKWYGNSCTEWPPHNEAELSRVTERMTDTAHIGNNSLHLMHSMQPKNRRGNRCSWFWISHQIRDQKYSSAILENDFPAAGRLSFLAVWSDAYTC